MRRRRRRAISSAPWEWLRTDHPKTAERLDQFDRQGSWSPVDRARIVCALEDIRSSGALPEELVMVIRDDGPAALVHPSGLRTLPGAQLERHDLVHGHVLIGRTVPGVQSTSGHGDLFGIDHDVLRTSLLVIGPPGSGKTQGLARPIVEHLCLSALTNQASVVVIDVKGDDFADQDWFDITIDPLNPSVGFDLYGGATDPDQAADRLASALMPPKVSDEPYFVHSSKNALYACLAPYRIAHDRWPSIRELLGLLRGEQSSTDDLRRLLKLRNDPAAKDARRLLDTRAAQIRRRDDPAASMVEQFQLLDRPALTGLFDHPGPAFRMPDINRPTRVRVVLREANLPDAARILARLVVAQFVNTTASPDTNRAIFKGLVIDEAGRFVDDYVARGIQTVRSNNAGLILLTQTVSDFAPGVWGTVFGSTGCKVVFGGIGVLDADIFSTWLGEDWVTETTYQINRQHTRTRNAGWSVTGGTWGFSGGSSESYATSAGSSFRKVERRRWSISDLTTGLPPGCCVATLTRSNGERFGPAAVDLHG